MVMMHLNIDKWQIIIARQCDHKALAAKFATTAIGSRWVNVDFLPKMSDQYF